MRLRPTQFVFLLLLACSVQVRQGYLLRLTSEAVSGSARAAFQASHIPAASVQRSPGIGQAPQPSVQALSPSPESLAAFRTTWAMRWPNAKSTAVISFTGFLRA